VSLAVGDQRSAGSPPRGRRGEVITGRLQEHGKANYQFQPDGSPSYYLTLLTSRGPETLWTTDRQRTFYRARWRVEEVSYLAKSMQSAERAVKSRLEDKRAMTERPELRSAFISLHVAQQYAEKNIRDPRDRDLFVTRVKAVMAASVRNGAPVPEPRVVEDGATRATRATNRDEPTR
jgi:hypothetical protein